MIIFNSISFALSRFVGAASNFLLFPILLSYWTSFEISEYIVHTSEVLLIFSIFDFGIIGFMTNEYNLLVGEGKYQESATLFTSSFFYSICSYFIVLGAYAMARVSGDGNSQLIDAFLISIPVVVYQFFLGSSCLLRQLNRINIFHNANIIYLVGNFMISFASVRHGCRPSDLFLTIAISNIIFSVLYIIYLKKCIITFKINYRITGIVDFVKNVKSKAAGHLFNCLINGWSVNGMTVVISRFFPLMTLKFAVIRYVVNAFKFPMGLFLAFSSEALSNGITAGDRSKETRISREYHLLSLSSLGLFSVLTYLLLPYLNESHFSHGIYFETIDIGVVLLLVFPYVLRSYCFNYLAILNKIQIVLIPTVFFFLLFCIVTVNFVSDFYTLCIAFAVLEFVFFFIGLIKSRSSIKL